MPRSKQDPYKRKMAQGLNHLSNAIVDVHEVYAAFDERIANMTATDVENGVPNNAEAIERYKVYRETLKQTMMYMAIPREEILKLIDSMWGLDEESIKVYLG